MHAPDDPASVGGVILRATAEDMPVSVRHDEDREAGELNRQAEPQRLEWMVSQAGHHDARGGPPRARAGASAAAAGRPPGDTGEPREQDRSPDQHQARTEARAANPGPEAPSQRRLRRRTQGPARDAGQCGACRDAREARGRPTWGATDSTTQRAGWPIQVESGSSPGAKHGARPGSTSTSRPSRRPRARQPRPQRPEHRSGMDRSTAPACDRSAVPSDRPPEPSS
jgi:hypothetical protein